MKNFSFDFGIMQSASRPWRQPFGRGHPKRRSKSLPRHVYRRDNINSDNSDNSDSDSFDSLDNSDYVNNNNSDNSDHVNNNNSRDSFEPFDNKDIDWDMLIRAIRQLNRRDPCRKSYDGLLKHNVWPSPKFIIPRWKPLGHMLHWFLLLGWYSPTLNLTRVQMEFILNLLLTMQFYGYFDESIWIPTDASTIAKWKRWFAMPPVGMLYYYIFFLSLLLHYYCIFFGWFFFFVLFFALLMHFFSLVFFFKCSVLIMLHF
ncbi:MAG: hypothetical protein ACPG2Y_03350 [Acholeplasmataceae bacterium]